MTSILIDNVNQAIAAGREAQSRLDKLTSESLDAPLRRPAAAVPEPAFRLTWRDGQYRVSKPNIGDTDCYTTEQVRAMLAAAARKGGES